MKISIKLILANFVIVGIAAAILLQVFFDEVWLGMSKATEETMIDTANVLAVFAAEDMAAGSISSGRFTRDLSKINQREVNANIWGVAKKQIKFRVYITDAKGFVVYDSQHEWEGKDFSQWNDVHKTLKGQYGARSTPQTEADHSSIMYIAAPVVHEGKTIGVLSIGKPTITQQPFFESGKNTTIKAAVLLIGSALIIGLFFSFRLTRSIQRIAKYARTVAQGHRAAPPSSRTREISDLCQAIEDMRTKLEGKDYVEQYVHTLTHEMKSPVSAISGAAELLGENNLPETNKQRFIDNIQSQIERLKLIIDRMLFQVKVENQQILDDISSIDLTRLITEIVHHKEPELLTRQIEIITLFETEPHVVKGNAFLLSQSISNLIDNAIAFSSQGQKITISIEQNERITMISVTDQGTGIPDYAIPHIFDRFYSLARPSSGQKSTGLGLSFVKEVAELHNGSITIENLSDGGVKATLILGNL